MEPLTVPDLENPHLIQAHQLPGSYGLPFLGETLEFAKDPAVFLKIRQQKYGNIYKTRLFGHSTVIVSGAEIAQFLFSKGKEYIRQYWPAPARKLISENALVHQDGIEHSKTKRLLRASFTREAIAGYLPIIEQNIQSALNEWEETKIFSFKENFRDFIFGILLSILGIEKTRLHLYKKHFDVWTKGWFAFPVNIPGTSFQKAYKARQELLKLISDDIESYQKNGQYQSQNKVLYFLLKGNEDTGEKLDIETIKENVLLLLFGGFETSASTLTNLFLFLTKNPAIKNKIRDELKSFNMSNQYFTLETLGKMASLEDIIKETMRYYPPGACTFHKVTRAITIGNYLIPKDWLIFFSIVGTHYDSKIYSCPHMFDPSRFCSETNSEKLKSGAYLPFGGGAHICLGAELAKVQIKALAARILSSYDWEALPNQDLQVIADPIPYPKDGLKVQFKRIYTQSTKIFGVH